jgi:hypothetical protein
MFCPVRVRRKRTGPNQNGLEEGCPIEWHKLFGIVVAGSVIGRHYCGHQRQLLAVAMIAAGVVEKITPL